MPATVRALCLALLALCAQPAVAVQPLLTCDFGSYPAEPAPAENTPLRIDNEFARTFRTQLSKAAQQPPDFAGTQHLVTWGCGTGCIEGGLVDATSGRAHPLPFSLHRGIQEPLPPLQYQINSRLLVASGARSEQEEGSPLHCYQFTNGALKPLTACPCAPLATDADLGRIDGEVRTCAAEHATDEGAFSACLLAASRHDITRLKQQVEALGGSWHMAMDSDDQRLVEHFLHTSAIIYKLPDGADSLERHRQRLALRTHVDSMMYLIHRREQLREDPNTFLSAQPAVPLRPVSGDGKPRNLER